MRNIQLIEVKYLMIKNKKSVKSNTNIKKVDIIQNISVITLNVNKLNDPNKKLRLLLLFKTKRKR